MHLSDYCESFRNNHINPSVRFLRHAINGVQGYYRIPPGGQHAYRHEAYSSFAALLGGPVLAEWTLLNDEQDKTGPMAEWMSGQIPTGTGGVNLSATGPKL